MTVIMRLPDSVTRNMKEQFRPIECICGCSEIVMIEEPDHIFSLACIDCGHHGPGKYESDYVSCVMAWNAEVMQFEELLEIF